MPSYSNQVQTTRQLKGLPDRLLQYNTPLYASGA